MRDLDRLVAGLRRPEAYSHPVRRVDHIETHISHVLLAGGYAYKLKKGLNLGFLDFSTLERRKFCCDEELRLNRRLAPDVYLGVVPVTGTEREPRMGGEGEVLEYAVKMRRFGQDRLLNVLPLEDDLPERIAERVAGFHQAIPSADRDSAYGTPGAVLKPMRHNFEQIRSRISEPQLLERLGRLEDWTQSRHRALTAVLEQRRSAGFIRECHGDMHRGNIALDAGEILIFDGIEFNPSLRWIDTMSELAFLVMDLEEAGEAPQARRLLNRYLELTGDYGGLPVLDFYKVYRAMVRAKVIAIRLGQADVGLEEAARDEKELEGYLDLAGSYTRTRALGLFLTHGLSGSGKSHVCSGLRARLPVIHVRSDIERKRLFGFAEDARTSPGGIRAGIYAADAGRRTYERLRALAGTILDAGYSPLVDATFLTRAQRAPFLALAREKGIGCSILEFRAPEALLRRRVVQRAGEGTDPSEAGLDVLEHQLATVEPLTEQERDVATVVDSVSPDVIEGLVNALAAAPELSESDAPG
jgi:aminoglycoside phosphotransferase family enzyme/predicted kinase